MGSGQCVAVLCVIPVIVDIHGHRFEVFMLVSEIHDNVDLVLGMKNVFELEGIKDIQDSSFKFLNRSLAFFSKEQVVVKSKEGKFIKIEAPFVDKISGLAIVKMLDVRTVYSSIEICKELSIIRCHTQYARNGDI